MPQDVRLTDEQNTLRRASLLGLSYTDTSQMPEKQLYKELLPVSELYRMRVVPLSVEKGAIKFGITTTTSQQTMTQIVNQFLDSRVSFSLISDAGFKEFMMLYDPPKQVIYQDIKIGDNQQSTDIAQVSSTLEQVKADDMLAYLTSQAHKLQASDIHIETGRDGVRIRFRIDGVLHPIANISIERNRMLTSAVASAANVSTAADSAQQGHITQSVKMADGQFVDVNLRVETVPAINGMDIVMRLFNMDASMYSLDRLGLSTEERKIVDQIIQKPSGLVLAVGPTGSGKTTTLYSILNSLNSDTRKIITLEDPVEYQFEGITQVSITSKSNDESHFANSLRATLRLDPDIVMVGEIRDNDTAKTALQASLTGHLVLSTFHAGSAAAALTRMVDIIGQNPLFVSAIRLIMAQRLVRRLDDKTKQSYTPSPEMLKRIQDIVGAMPPSYPKPNLEGLVLYKPGTSDENPYGFKGQIALREQMQMTEPLRKMLSTNTTATTQDLEKAAIEGGMLTMLQSAVLKLIAGETTVEEVFRVLG